MGRGSLHIPVKPAKAGEAVSQSFASRATGQQPHQIKNNGLNVAQLPESNFLAVACYN